MKYIQLPHYSAEEINKAVNENVISELEIIPLSLGEYCAHSDEAVKICLELSQHSNPKIRANSVLGISYIARNAGRLNKKAVLPLLEKEYRENIEFRGVICDAIDDILLYLKWKRPGWYTL